MEFFVVDFDVNVFNPAVDEFVNNQWHVWPQRLFAFYKRIEPQDLREGMVNIYALEIQADDTGNGRSRTMKELGVINQIRVSGDPNGDHEIMITSVLSGETVEWVHRVIVLNARNHVGSSLYQRYEWDLFPVNHLTDEIVKSNTWQLHHYDSRLKNHIVSTTFGENLDNPSASRELWQAWIGRDEEQALYRLVPAHGKVKRALEDIPPMPGESRPEPSPSQPGDGGKPKPGDEIPPMPGESRNISDKNLEGPKTGVGAGWWGTRDGEGK